MNFPLHCKHALSRTSRLRSGLGSRGGVCLSLDIPLCPLWRKEGLAVENENREVLVHSCYTWPSNSLGSLAVMHTSSIFGHCLPSVVCRNSNVVLRVASCGLSLSVSGSLNGHDSQLDGPNLVQLRRRRTCADQV